MENVLIPCRSERRRRRSSDAADDDDAPHCADASSGFLIYPENVSKCYWHFWCPNGVLRARDDDVRQRAHVYAGPFRNCKRPSETRTEIYSADPMGDEVLPNDEENRGQIFTTRGMTSRILDV